MAAKSSNGSGEQVKSATVKNEAGDRKMSLFLWRSPSGTETVYFTVATDKLACGARTRSLRHGDWEQALEWAQGQVDDESVVLDAIEIEKTTVKTGKEKAAKPTKKAADKGRQELPKWPLKIDPTAYLEKYGEEAKNSELAKQCVAAGGFTR